MCLRRQTSRTHCTMRRSPPRRRSCFRRPRWASSSRSSPLAAERPGRCSGSSEATALPPFKYTLPAMRALGIALLILFFDLAHGDELDAARQRWASSPHGPMLERILPPTFSPAQLPEPASEGARLTLRYCVQCHNLSNPAMHQAEKWPAIVERMVLRMQGRGNMGALMHEMMAGIAAPAADETRALVAYLQK